MQICFRICAKYFSIELSKFLKNSQIYFARTKKSLPNFRRWARKAFNVANSVCNIGIASATFSFIPSFSFAHIQSYFCLHFIAVLFSLFTSLFHLFHAHTHSHAHIHAASFALSLFIHSLFLLFSFSITIRSAR